MIIRIEGPVGFGPYRYRQYFLERLWDETECSIDYWRSQGMVPSDQPGFIEWRLRLRKARALHYQLKKRFINPTEEALRNMGQAFGLN